MAIDIDRITADLSFEHFAEPVVISGKEVRGIAARELITLDATGGMVEERLTLEVMLSEVPLLRQGVAVVVRGKDYRVDRPMEGDSDFGVTMKVLLR